MADEPAPERGTDPERVADGPGHDEAAEAAPGADDGIGGGEETAAQGTSAGERVAGDAVAPGGPLDGAVAGGEEVAATGRAGGEAGHREEGPATGSADGQAGHGEDVTATDADAEAARRGESQTQGSAGDGAQATGDEGPPTGDDAQPTGDEGQPTGDEVQPTGDASTGARFLGMAPEVPDAAPEPATDALSTGCQSLDTLLDGGLERDAITLVFGEGGSGKTNLALQCARQVTAAGNKVAYVDTEGVSARRMEQVFGAEQAADADRILFFTPYSILEQEKMVAKTALLRDVGLIVIDSVNMHYRLHIDDKDSEKEASASLFKQLHHLTGHARKHRIPVLVTGQVYGGEDMTQPFARRVMEHMVKALVRFEKRPDGSRRATVIKHRSIPEGRRAGFKIGPSGLEDV